MPRLYDLLGEFERAYDAAVDAADEDGLVPPEWAQTLAAVEGEFDAKIQAYGRLIVSLSSDRDAIDAEAKRLIRRAMALSRRVDALKEAVKTAMQAAGKTRVLGVPTVSLVQNSVASVIVDDDAAIPPEYYVVPKPSLSKSAIGKAIEDGKAVPGCRLERGVHVRVR